MAECHPVGFQWVMEAKARGAKVIHIDPRFTRTSRAGRPARAAAGRQRHRLPRRDHQLHPEQREVLPRLRRRLHQRGDDPPRGLPRHRGPRRACSPATTPRPAPTTRPRWHVRGPGGARRSRHARGSPGRAAARHPQRGRGVGPGAGGRARDGWPRRGHGARRRAPGRDAAAPRTASSRCSSGTTPATPPRWCRQTCGVPPETFLEVCEAVDRQQRPRPDHRLGLLGRLDPPHGRRAVHPRSAHHPAAAGQHGPPGGGILALRGHASIQGSTDIPTLFNLLPGLPADAQGRRARHPARTTSTASSARA